MSLKNKARSSTIWTTLSTALPAFMQLIQIMILVRLLDKKDFGLMAMATTIIGISQIFIDLGLSNAIIQKKNITDEQLDTLFWLNIIVGFLIAVLISLTAVPISYFYNEPQLVGILNLVGLTFIIQSFGQQHTTLLQKEILVKPLSLSIIISRTGGLLLSIYLAHKNYGVHSLIYSNVFSALLGTILVIYSGRKLYTPSYTFSWSSIKKSDFFSFGSYQMAAKFAFYLTTQSDTIFIGKLLNTESLGIYSIAKTLAFKPVDIIAIITSKVTFPILVKFQDSEIELKRMYLQILKLLVNINAPICVFMIVLAKPLVIICFGPKWIEAAAYIQWLCIAAFITNIWGTLSTLLLSRGHARLDFLANIILLFLVPISVILGYRWDIVGIAFSQAITRIIFLIFAWLFVKRSIPKMYFDDVIQNLIWPLTFSVFCGLIVQVVIPYIKVENEYLQLATGGVLISLVSLSILYIFDRSFFLKSYNLFIRR